jgi:hypothetical protein
MAATAPLYARPETSEESGAPRVIIWLGEGQIRAYRPLASPTNSGDLVHIAWFAAQVLPDNAISAAACTEGRVQYPGLSWWFVVEPPAGIEPATPSLPWIGGQAPC